ncbi:helix-turn-helix domain-containing protein [Nocardioides sp. Arc9.136]|uniref:AraC family transcriptional regulator n=1 Tax=Nocardioides sp. Arc9.136 TaxID=2996826 RepID=UPI002666D0E0|nr:helix-turn-helix domain-containing protein [Nocardioides sp. Arc9.136]WKN47022.1 helix-turn-helix domain-containing protein [Nocardioides sp. Arc9.136]
MTWSVAPIEVDEPAHLRDARGFTPSLRRWAPPAALDDVVRRFWVPVWSLPPGASSVQRVLQHPVCQLVVGSEEAVLVGPDRGMGTRELRGSGWAVGVMLQPAAGTVLAGGPMTALTDRQLDLAAVRGLDAAGGAAGLASRVRAVMAPGPADPERQAEACSLLATALAALLPVDEEGLLVNRLVAEVEADPGIRRVGDLCERFATTERTLQRLTARRIGLSPKWLVQRRRLHEVAERLRAGEGAELATVAAELGYADQSHLTRDFRAVTGTTPGAFAAEPR